MGLLDKLQSQGSTLSQNNGSTPTIPDFANSKLHKNYSITGEPNIVGKPGESQLDLDGEINNKYLENLPS